MMKQISLIFFLVILLTFWTPAQDSKENADFKLAVSLYNDKLYDLAIEQFRAFINLYPNTAQGIEAHFYLGLTESKLGKHDDSRFTFQNFALAYPDHVKAPEAWMNAAEEYAAMKNDREAAMAFERVKTFYPKNKLAPAGLFKAAEYYDKIGEKENTRRVLRSLTQEYTTAEVLPARLKLAELYSANGEYGQARQECKRVVDVDCGAQLKSRALLLMGQSLIGLEKNSEAEIVISEVVKNFKSTTSYYNALFILGKLKSLAGNTDEAMVAWQTVIADNTKAPKQLQQDVCIEIAETNNNMRSYPQALSFLERAGEIRGRRNGEAFYKAGVAAERGGNRTKAAQNYSRAFHEVMDFQKDSVGNVDYRAIAIGAFKAATITKNYTESIRLVHQYRQQFPSDANLARLLIEGATIAKNELGDTKTAIEFCEWILEHFPQSQWIDDATFILGQTRNKSGDIEGAIAAFESLQRLYPSSEFIPEAQKQNRFIRAFNQRDKETGFQKLALLVGDVIAQKSRGNLAYRLAEIYFSDLKDYKIAAEQYAYALSIDLEDDLRPTAWFKRGQSFEMLSLKEGEKTVKGKEFLAQAIDIYDSLVAHYPAGEFTDQAFITAFMLRVKSAEKPKELQTLGTDFLAKSIGMHGKDAALLSLGDSYLQAKDYENAILTYRFLSERYSNSEAASSAQYQLGIALDAMMKKDSALLVFEQFLDGNQNHLKSADAAAYLAKTAADSGQLVQALRYFDLLEKRYFYSKLNSNLDVRKSDAYFNTNDYENAADGYERGLKKLRTDFFIVTADPEVELSIVFRLGVCNEKLGNRSAAKKWYAEYVMMDHTTERAGKAYYALAIIAKGDNNIGLATRYMQNASRIMSKVGSQNAPIAFETAEMLFNDEKYSDAIVKYEEALLQTANDTLKLYLQSRIAVSYFRLDNLKEADARASELAKAYRSSRIYDNAAEFEFERGKYQIRKDNLLKARERFNNVVHSYPKAPIVPEALYWNARIYELEQKIPQAVILYDSLLHHFPNDKIIPRVQLSLGNAYYSLEKWEAASKQYRAILEDEERSPDLIPLAMSNLIMTYKEVGLFDAALELTRKYIDRFPEDPEIIDKKIDIGVIYQKLRYYDQSILQLQSLIDAGNSSIEGELRYYIGEAYFYKGEYQQAILEFLKVPYLVSRRGKMDWNSTSYYMAGQSYEKMSKYDQAIVMYKQIIDRKDTDPQFKTAAQKEIDRVKSIIGKKK
jgi:TolA-binding protein